MGSSWPSVLLFSRSIYFWYCSFTFVWILPERSSIPFLTAFSIGSASLGSICPKSTSSALTTLSKNLSAKAFLSVLGEKGVVLNASSISLSTNSLNTSSGSFSPNNNDNDLLNHVLLLAVNSVIASLMISLGLASACNLSISSSLRPSILDISCEAS